MNKRIVEHSQDWKQDFQQQANTLKEVLDKDALAIHHIGSTAIPNIPAKPIIDILVETSSHQHVDTALKELSEYSFIAKGEYGIPGRRYFHKNNNTGVRTHHIHMYETGSHHLHRHLVFRDYLLAHPDKAQAYADLKIQLADNEGWLPHDYQERKSAFIKKIEQEALDWLQHTTN